ncbi:MULTISPECIES: fatty acid desaturase family protein [Sphingobium]|uniref:Fatty acid desaturase n=1 Tax=Sphingobium fuliginis (strain ATCC 27551) TaxID=336203 RepID=A0ABQ1F0X6_SPHSA|nr:MULTISPECIES: fatty acid desaturase family protein [Sphingobium]RYL97267.1 fatty acid desaturase [Sphingobium fuliginis]WDA35682.1 fatty acid desaturase family protein [Sphingobium sp. YC-XJ3]GFZ96048.1 fatty acid desaturase [Sphingobium fuliginis]
MEESAKERPPGYRYSRRGTLALIRDLSVIDDRRNALLLVLQWAIAIGAGAIAIHVDRIPVYLLAGIVIGTRIQCLAVMMHDACHGMLFSNRRLNDLIGDIFVAYPLGFSVDLYRANHLHHHRYTNTLRDRDYRVQRRDPDQHFPKSAAAMAWLLVRSVTGLNLYRMARDSRVWAPFANFHNPRRFGYDFPLGLRIRYVLWALLFYGLILLSPYRWKILGLLLIPQFIWANVFNRIRAMAEHNGVSDESELKGTRTVIPTLLDRFLIAPFNVSYHLEHHLFPSVPWPNLRRLHAHLMTDPVYAAEAHVTQSYWGVIRELMPPPLPAGEGELAARPEVNP